MHQKSFIGRVLPGLTGGADTVPRPLTGLGREGASEEGDGRRGGKRKYRRQGIEKAEKIEKKRKEKEKNEREEERKRQGMDREWEGEKGRGEKDKPQKQLC